MEDHKKELLKAYQDATVELRHMYDDDFHAILKRLYAEREINVKKRRSNRQAEKARLEAALKLVREHNII